MKTPKSKQKPADSAAPGTETATPRWRAWVLPVLIGFLATAHLPFVIWNAYGSDDAAWDGIAIMLWAQHDRLPTETGIFVEERFRSSPLPAYLIKRVLVARLVPYTSVPVLMNVATLLAGVLVPGLLFLLARRLASGSEAAMAVVLLLLSPEFFSLKFDGLPTLPALALLLLSLLLFVSAIQRPRRRAVSLVLSACFLSLAVLTKVDVVLLSPAFLVISLMAPLDGGRWKYAVLSLALPLLCLVVWHLFCQAVAPDAPQTAETFQRWSHRWALVPRGLWDHDNLSAMLMAPGAGTALALIPALAFCTLTRQGKWLAAAALACILPTILFWGMRELNSSRHNFWIVIPLALLVAAVVQRTFRDTAWKTAAIAAICVGNYLLGPGPAQDTYRQATADFLTAAQARKAAVQKDHDDYELLLRKRGPITKMCIWPVGRARARAIATFIAHADYCEVKVVGRTHNDWRLQAKIGDESLSVWLPDMEDPQTVLPEICREQYDLFRPGNAATPFFHVRGEPEAAGATNTLQVEFWP